MDKKQAANFLGVSERTIENYAKAGKLSVVYFGGKADYKESELKALKTEKETPVHKAMVSIPNESEAVISGDFGDITTVPQASLAKFLEEVAAQVWTLPGNKLVFGLEEAAAKSGFSKYHLRSAIAHSHLKAKKVGRGWKIRPQDLERYTNWLFADENKILNA